MRSIQDIGGWVDVGFGHGGVFLLIYLRGGWVLVWFFLQNTSQPLHMIVHTSAIYALGTYTKTVSTKSVRSLQCPKGLVE